jgi:iron complex transport system substrate-binding protein
MHRTLRLPALLAALLAALTLAACGSAGDDRGTTGSAASEGTTVASNGPEPGAFPVTIPHRYGETTIDAEPKRVVVAGLREQDALLALGVDPVATTEWYGKHPGAIFPWAKEALGGRPLPEVLDFTDGIQFEKIAALRPDLILAVYSGLSRDDYDKLSAIAPTVAQPKGEVDWGSSWQEELTISGQAVGRPQRAAEVLAKTQRLLDETAKAHPEFAGKTGVVASTYNGIYVYGPQDARSRFLNDLGFVYPRQLRDIGKDDFGGQLSTERTDLIDQDLVLWFAEPDKRATLFKGPYGRLAVHTEGHDVFLAEKGTLYEATSFISPLSIPLLVDQLVPKLSAAVQGQGAA